MRRRTISIIATFATVLWAGSAAALIIGPPLPITHQVQAQLIQVSEDDGGNTAPLLGTVAEQALIEDLIDQVWAQAGIDVLFLPSVTAYDETFVHSGTPGSNDPRPTADLAAIMATAAIDGVLHADPLILNFFFVQIAPGSSQNGDNTVNGIAFIGANGSTAWVGPNLPGFGLGRDAVASVLSHEIGHNLGLPHITEIENLMQSSLDPFQGERLNAAQISTAQASAFAVLVPEPGSLALVALGMVGIATLRRRR